MPESSQGNSGSNFSIKELLTEFVLPRLDSIDQRMEQALKDMDSRMRRIEPNAERVAIVEKRVDELEHSALRPIQVREIIKESVQDSETRGWTKRERIMGVLLLLLTVGNFLINLLVGIIH